MLDLSLPTQIQGCIYIYIYTYWYIYSTLCKSLQIIIYTYIQAIHAQYKPWEYIYRYYIYIFKLYLAILMHYIIFIYHFGHVSRYYPTSFLAYMYTWLLLCVQGYKSLYMHAYGLYMHLSSLAKVYMHHVYMFSALHAYLHTYLLLYIYKYIL